ncbi:hypothetical protein D3Z60_09475 [Lachnospiraceae bacterium]|nr:hypothetical protein [Lachnospiraceae bacterium]
MSRGWRISQTKEPDGKSLYRHIACQKAGTRALSVLGKTAEESAGENKQDTHGGVYSHRLSYLIHHKSAKRRRLFLWQVK